MLEIIQYCFQDAHHGFITIIVLSIVFHGIKDWFNVTINYNYYKQIDEDNV